MADKGTAGECGLAAGGSGLGEKVRVGMKKIDLISLKRM